MAQRERIVVQNEHLVALVPFWAVWPFETMRAAASARVARLADLDTAQRDGLADMLQQLTSHATTRCSNVSFPYSMGLHPAPPDGEAHPEWQFHLHFYPPLLRSATVRKFMVGFELLGSPQRDITPESAAETLRQAAAKRPVENWIRTKEGSDRMPEPQAYFTPREAAHMLGISYPTIKQWILTGSSAPAQRPADTIGSRRAP